MAEDNGKHNGGLLDFGGGDNDKPENQKRLEEKYAAMEDKAEPKPPKEKKRRQKSKAVKAEKDAGSTAKRRKYLIYTIVFWALYATFFTIIFVIFLRIATGGLGWMPTFEELENPETNLASEIITSDGQLLGKYFIENRTFVDFDDLSPHLVNALIATEDIRFHDHSGIDFLALGRVVWGVLTRDHKGGGSTISQQLAKNLFKMRADSARYESGWGGAVDLGLTKFKEWVTAVRLEKNYTKEEILVMYLNTVDFGHQAFGIKSAARTFFDKTPDSLTVLESAVLVGLLKAPTLYSPVINPENSKHRRNVVLHQMRKYGFLDQAAFDTLETKSLQLNINAQTHYRGPAPYFREYLRGYLTQTKPNRDDYFDYEKFRQDSLAWLNDPLFGWCNKNLKPDGSPYDVYRDGLKIYVTIDARMQEYAEQAMREHMGGYLQPEFFKRMEDVKRAPFAWNVEPHKIKQLMESSIRRTERYRTAAKRGKNHDEIMEEFEQPVKMRVFTWEGEKDTVMTPRDSILYYKHFLRAGFMAMDPHNGEVKAYVGGINYKHFKFDAVSLGRRQVGSTFKPFLYTLAMQEDRSPCDMVPNVKTTIELPNGDQWAPRSATKEKYHNKMVSLKWALAMSENYVSALLMKQIGPIFTKKMAHKLGIKTDFIAVHSIALGSVELYLKEMVGAYSTYANKGVHVDPLFVTRIEDRQGNVLARFVPYKNEAISEKTAYLMLKLMEGVVQFGTSIRLRTEYKLTAEMAGKTGTTDNNSDGWFMGITPNLVAGAWVGGEDYAVRFWSTDVGQGAAMALPIVAKFLQKVYKDENLPYSQEDRFPVPSGFKASDFNCDEAVKDLDEGFDPDDELWNK